MCVGDVSKVLSVRKISAWAPLSVIVRSRVSCSIFMELETNFFSLIKKTFFEIYEIFVHDSLLEDFFCSSIFEAFLHTKII